MSVKAKGVIPGEKAERERIRSAVGAYVAARSLVPPLSLEELEGHARELLHSAAIPDGQSDFVSVLVSNAVWRDTLAAVPYERRVLLLPQCLRAKEQCAAELDEYGLLCAQCGRCAIGALQAEAEELGYVVLVAEGTTLVTRLLDGGKVDAVVGVSCLGVMEKAFPHFASDAIPGIAIPLLRDGCEHTQADLDWIREAIRLRSNGSWASIDPDAVRTEVLSWFDRGYLARLMDDGTQTARIGIDWLGKSGKRVRPLLAACAFKALNGGDGPWPPMIRKIGVAVECFHKASLVHDDIEDNDDCRYGEKTLHREHGVPVALNVGDLLLGEGYRLIASCGAPPQQIARMLSAAAEGHRSLCLGQGEELSWMRERLPIASREVIEIFRRKTAPAFEVSLRLGAIVGGAGEDVCRVLQSFSEALGIAYQIHDDLEDFHQPAGADSDVAARRLSLLFALAHEQASESDRVVIARVWREGGNAAVVEDFRRLVAVLRTEEKARQLAEHYKNEAIRALSPLRNAELKSLLRRIVTKILGRA